MSTRSLGRLTLDLIAKTGGFTGPLDRAGRTTERQFRKMERDAKKAAAGITAVTAAAAAAAAGAVAYTRSAAMSARELQNQAQVANASTQELQRIAYATEQFGISQEKLSDILKDVSDRIGDFIQTGGGPMADFFENIAPKVGVTAEQFRQLSGPQALQLYYDSLEKANLAQSDLTFYLEAMASDTTALIPLLRNGGKELSAMADEADRLGIVLDEVQIDNLTEFARQSDRISAAMSAASQVAASELAPTLTQVADNLVDIASAFQQGEYDAHIEAITIAGSAAAGAAGAYGAYRLAVSAATIAQWAFNVAVRANPIGASIAVIGAAAGAVYAFREDVTLAGREAAQASIDVDNLAGSFRGLTRAQQENRRMEMAGNLAEMRIEAGRLGSELARVSQLVRQSGQLDEHGGALPIATSEDIARGRELRSQLGQILVDVEAGSKVLAEYDALMEETLGGGGGAGGGSSPATKAIARQIDALQQQAATLGMTSDQATLYKLALDGATESQLRAAAAALEMIGAHERQQQITEDYQQLLVELRTEEEALNAQMHERLAILDAAKVSAEEYGEVLSRVARGAFSDAPEYSGLDAVIGGAFGELNKINEAQEELQKWYATQLEMLDSYRKERADLSEAWDAQERTLKEEHENELARIEQARQVAQLQAASALFGDLAGLTRAFAGEQSGIYQTMFAIQKAAAVAQSIVAIQQGIAMAAANPWPQNLAAMASVASATAGIVTNIMSVAAPQGMAHDGIDSIPQTGTWLLEKGERVTTAETSAKLDATLARIEQGMDRPGGGGGVTISAPITVQAQPGMSNQDAQRQGAMMGKALRAEVLKIMQDQQRPGGVLAKR